MLYVYENIDMSIKINERVFIINIAHKLYNTINVKTVYSTEQKHYKCIVGYEL